MGSRLEQKLLLNFGRRDKPAADSALSFAIVSSDWATVYERCESGVAIGGSKYSSYFKEGRRATNSLLLSLRRPLTSSVPAFRYQVLP